MNRVIPVNTYEFLCTRKCNMNCSYCFEKDKSGKDTDPEKMYELVSNNGLNMDLSVSRFYMFGGETLLSTKILDKFIDMINSNPKLSRETKDEYIAKVVNNLTTNGTLIDKEIEFLKRYNATLQISLDGPEDINDLCRVDYNGKGHFKQIMDNIKLCQINGIKYTVHGACSNANYKNFSRIIEWFLKIQLDNPNHTDIRALLDHNYLQIVFEDNITDEDINILLSEYQKSVEIILYSDILSDYPMSTRMECACGFLSRKGCGCSAAISMYSFDDEFYIYPCHRLMTSGLEKEPHELSLGQLNSDKPWNYLFYENFIDTSTNKILYGPMIDCNLNDFHNFMANWCPSTNYECTGLTNVYPSKHNVLLAELNNFIPKLAEYYNLDINGYINKYYKGNK